MITTNNNWEQITKELMKNGLTQAEIAKQCDCSQSLISHLKNGKRVNPKFEIGNSLLELYSKINSD